MKLKDADPTKVYAYEGRPVRIIDTLMWQHDPRFTEGVGTFKVRRPGAARWSVRTTMPTIGALAIKVTHSRNDPRFDETIEQLRTIELPDLFGTGTAERAATAFAKQLRTTTGLQLTTVDHRAIGSTWEQHLAHIAEVDAQIKKLGEDYEQQLAADVAAWTPVKDRLADLHITYEPSRYQQHDGDMQGSVTEIRISVDELARLLQPKPPSRFYATPAQVDAFLREHLSEDVLRAHQWAIGDAAAHDAAEDIRQALTGGSAAEAADRIDPAKGGGHWPARLVTFEEKKS